MVRLATALLLSALVLVLVKLAPPWAFQLAAAAGTLVATWEGFRIFEARGSRPFKLLGLAAAAGVLWAYCGHEPRLDAAVPIVAATAGAMLAALWWRSGPPAMLDAALGTVFPVVFVALPLSHALALRTVPGEQGEDLLILLLCCVAFADTAAYYVGSAIGRRPLAPRLSPKKSWEGVAGGLAGSVGAALLAHAWYYRALPLRHAFVLGVALGVLAILGDLAESMLKRAAGVKDSSSVLPGHGGLLDRGDSLLFACPALYYYYLTFLQGAS